MIINSKEKNIIEFPTVTIGIPVLNEERHIERVVRGFLSTDYPSLKEILIADGGSSDQTREIVTKLNLEDSRVKLVENLKKFQSFGLNIMIEIAEGDIFLRADGHCYYNNDYVTKCVEVMLETESQNVGGAQRYMASNKTQAGIALAVKSFLGNGGAKYMDTEFEGFSDTVFLGCFWTKELRKAGGFNTENITNQDAELNLRLIEKFGETIFISPKIKSWYYPRNSFKKLFKQYFRYGRGRFLTRSIHPGRTPLRALVPFLTLLSLLVFVQIDLLISTYIFSAEVILALILITLLESMRISIKMKNSFIEEVWRNEGPPPGFIIRVLSCSFSLVLMQIGHFSGFLYQLLKRVFKKSKKW